MPLDRPIPAFYCCYLLRSTVRHARVYVGSTPNPVRRLGQHNGITKGGAVRTSRDSLRPWEMACIVTGFPSHIAALQFEWAWQNPHITQHIPPEARIQHATQKKRSGHPRRPVHTVSSLLANLHLLLRVPSFSRWPLDVRFFNQDVHKAWLKWSRTVAEPVRDSLSIITDFSPTDPEPEPESDESPKSKRLKIDHGIAKIDVDYTREKGYVTKAKEIVDFEQEGSCSICKHELEHDAGIYTICSNPGCNSVTHMTCLSDQFLRNEPDSLIPIKGTCPSCKTELRWVDMVKELSLRMRGQKEVENLLKVKRVRKGKLTAPQSILDSDDETEMNDDGMERDIAEEFHRLQDVSPTGTKSDIGDRWHAFDDSDDTDAGSVTSGASKLEKQSSRKKRTATVKTSRAVVSNTIIEDSDWDDALVLD